MNLLDLDPAAWWHAGLTIAANLFAFASGIVAVLLVVIALGATISAIRDQQRIRRTSRRAWRQHTG